MADTIDDEVHLQLRPDADHLIDLLRRRNAAEPNGPTC